ncbi:MAG: hypothetical protein LBG65_00955 [Puniceicoccales bacterium]|nr:hypothetical protein [Puniceicoccales bacterium]
MKKYADIITVQDAEYFLPVVDLANESENYWKQFVPTPQFYDLLERVLESVSSAQPGKRKSFWVQGTFGTGKSHASSVIRHLLCDDWADIAEYVRLRIEKPEVAAKLEALRRGKRLFPVVLKGVGGIHDTRTFRLELERTVKEALRNVKGAAQIAVNSDFENAISEIEKNPLLKLEEILPHKPKLRAIAKTKEDVIKKLRACDIELYLELEDALADYSFHLTSGNPGKWLSEVEKDIREKGIADGLIILWDEFTSVMDIISSGLTNMLQNIAELSEKQNVYLHLISHRSSTAHGDRGEDIRKMNDRFHIIQYRMEANTTYRLMAATLKVKDETEYERIFGERRATFAELIRKHLTVNDTTEAKEDILKLFPLHPYTASLCSAISSHIGSANRSVFNFIYEENGGFVDFVKKTDAEVNGALLTADHLWDFFRESFENDASKYGVVTETFNLHIRRVEEKGVHYAKVFKGALLLNALRNTYDNEIVTPSQGNISRLFEGEPWAGEMESILNWFNHNQIIQKDPLDNYIIEYSALPPKELNEEKRRQATSFSNAGKPDAAKVLGFEKSHQESVARFLGSDTLVRKAELVFLSCAYDETLVKSRLKQSFKTGSSLHIALFLSVREEEQCAAKNLVRLLAKSEDYKDVLFVVVNSALDNDGVQWDRFISYVATQEVARRHSLSDQSSANAKRASQLLENWTNRIKSNTINLCFREIEHNTTYAQLAGYINDHIGRQVFPAGVEAIKGLLTAPMTFWKEQISKKAVEIMILKQTRDAAEAEFKGQYLPARDLLRDGNGDFVVDEKLQLKQGAPSNHPLVQIQEKVDELIKRARERHPGGFYLGVELQPLTMAPFGLYGNFPNMAALGFALRKYIGEFNNADVGTTVSDVDLRDKVEAVFKFWKKENSAPDPTLNVRFGTKAERDLRVVLVRLFELEKIPGMLDLTSIKNVRWGIIGFCKTKSKKPLWCLKYAGLNEAVRRGITGIIELVEREETPQGAVETLLESLKENEYDIGEVVRKTDAFESGFASFLKTIEDVQLRDEWLGELNEFLSRELQDSVGTWREQDVKDKVKSFYIKKQIPPPPQQPVPPQQPQALPPTRMPSPPLSPERLGSVRKKIMSASNVDKMRETLACVLEKFPATADVIESSLE